MKVGNAFRIFAVCAALLSAAAPARAQVVVSFGNSLAYGCFQAAKAGDRPLAGLAMCDDALVKETLSARDMAATYDNRGVIKAALDRVDDALEDFNHSIGIDGTLGDAYSNRGSMLIRRKQFEPAIADIEKGLDLGMSSPEIGYYNRAVAEELTGKFRESYFDYMHVLQLAPDFAQAREHLKDFTVTRVPAKAD